MPYAFNPLTGTFDFYKEPTPGGTSGQVQFNNSGVFGGVSTTAVDGSGNLTFSGRWIQSTNGADSAPPSSLTGTWFSGGTSTTTKPQLLIEPTGTTSNTWSSAGTGFGVNAPSGFTGNLATFGINGTERVCITASGNVGIGTSAPSDVLHLGSGNARIGKWESGGSTVFVSAGIGSNASPSYGSLSFIGYSPTTSDVVKGRIRSADVSTSNSNLGSLLFEVQTGAATVTEVMRIAATGNVGIGTTAPLAKLDVKGSTLISATNNGNNILAFNDVAFAGGTLNGAPDGASGSAFIVGNGSTISGAPSYLSMWTTSGGVVSEKMRITATGNVGIGTTTPSAKLDVNGTSVFRTTSTFRDHSPELVSATAQGWRTTIYQSGAGGGGQNTFQRADGTESIPTNVKNGMSLGSFSFRGHNGSGFTGSKGFISVAASQDWTATANGTNISFDNTESNTTNLQTRMFIRHDGNIGIGTVSPTVKLEVNGQIRTAAPTGGTAASWRLGTVHTVTPTSPNRTIEVDIGGTIYYLHAKTTND